MQTRIRHNSLEESNRRHLLLLLLVLVLAAFLAGPGHNILHGDGHGESCPMAHIAIVQFNGDLASCLASGEVRWMQELPQSPLLPAERAGDHAPRAPPVV